jgi:hypothetical protein
MSAPLSVEELRGRPRSVVRDNLLTRPGYAPYCGNMTCPCGMPRTRFDGEQFACGCGWRSSFEAEFIAEYRSFASLQSQEP